jgi:hypothetical protein
LKLVFFRRINFVKEASWNIVELLIEKNNRFDIVADDFSEYVRRKADGILSKNF